MDTRLTFEPGPRVRTLWRGDGSRIVYRPTNNPYALYENPRTARARRSCSLRLPATGSFVVRMDAGWPLSIAVSTGGAVSDMLRFFPPKWTAQTRKLISSGEDAIQ